MFIKRLNQTLDSLTSSEEIIAEYISNHLSEIGEMTSVELSEKTGTAQATVIRFSKKLGYTSFKRMIKDIEVSKADNHVEEEIDFEEDTETTKNRLRNEYNMVFDLICEQNKNVLFENATKAISNANTVLIFGITSRKGDLAHYFTELLVKIGVNAIMDSYVSAIYARLEQCQENDVIILLSESGETRELLNFAKIAKKKKMITISITRFQKNNLASLSDINFKIIEYGQRTFLRNTVMMYAFQIVIDMIYLNIIKLNPKKSERLASRNSLVTKTNYIESN